MVRLTNYPVNISDIIILYIKCHFNSEMNASYLNRVRHNFKLAGKMKDSKYI